MLAMSKLLLLLPLVVRGRLTSTMHQEGYPREQHKGQPLVKFCQQLASIPSDSELKALENEFKTTLSKTLQITQQDAIDVVAKVTTFDAADCPKPTGRRLTESTANLEVQVSIDLSGVEAAPNAFVERRICQGLGVDNCQVTRTLEKLIFHNETGEFCPDGHAVDVEAQNLIVFGQCAEQDNGEFLRLSCDAANNAVRYDFYTDSKCLQLNRSDTRGTLDGDVEFDVYCPAEDAADVFIVLGECQHVQVAAWKVSDNNDCRTGVVLDGTSMAVPIGHCTALMSTDRVTEFMRAKWPASLNNPEHFWSMHTDDCSAFNLEIFADAECKNSRFNVTDLVNAQTPFGSDRRCMASTECNAVMGSVHEGTSDYCPDGYALDASQNLFVFGECMLDEDDELFVQLGCNADHTAVSINMFSASDCAQESAIETEERSSIFGENTYDVYCPSTTAKEWSVCQHVRAVTFEAQAGTGASEECRGAAPQNSANLTIPVGVCSRGDASNEVWLNFLSLLSPMRLLSETHWQVVADDCAHFTVRIYSENQCGGDPDFVVLLYPDAVAQLVTVRQESDWTIHQNAKCSVDDPIYTSADPYHNLKDCQEACTDDEACGGVQLDRSPHSNVLEYKMLPKQCGDDESKIFTDDSFDLWKKQSGATHAVHSASVDTAYCFKTDACEIEITTPKLIREGAAEATFCVDVEHNLSDHELQEEIDAQCEIAEDAAKAALDTENVSVTCQGEIKDCSVEGRRRLGRKMPRTR